MAGTNVARRVLRRAVPSAVALGVVAALLVVVGTRQSPNMVLVSGTDFTITGSVSNLYPGVPGSLVLNVQNAKAVPITVTSLSVSVGTAPVGCPASNLDLTGTSFTGSFNVPASGNANAPALPISLFASAPDACKNVSFGLNYTGTATYIQVFATSTGLVSSVNPSTVGQPVTFTATVTPTGTPPGPVTGSVTFSDGATPLGTVPIGTGGQAQLMTSTLTVGAHPIKAVFSNSDGNFSGSTSPTVTQQVSASTQATATNLTSSVNPSAYGQAVTFTATVTATSGTPSGSVTFKDGATPLATVALNGAGVATLNISTLAVGSHPISAAYAGNAAFLPSTSNTVNQVVNYTSCITTNKSGSLTVLSGQAICVTTTGTIGGSVTVNGGGQFFLLGGTVSGQVTVLSGGALSTTGGTITGLVKATAPTGVRLCSTKITGAVTVSGSTGFVLIGDGGDDGSPGCLGNNISGDVTISSGTAGFEVGGNTLGGSLTLTSNTGAGPTPEDSVPEIEANNVKKNLACTGNTPAPINDGRPNTVGGSRTGQCSAPGF